MSIQAFISEDHGIAALSDSDLEVYSMRTKRSPETDNVVELLASK